MPERLPLEGPSAKQYEEQEAFERALFEYAGVDPDRFKALTRNRSNMNVPMNERQITMLVVRYLAMVCEALNVQLHSGREMDVRKALERCTRCADHIEHIAKDDFEGVAATTRLQRLADSLEWLAVVRDEFDLELSFSGLHVPTANAMNEVRAAALALAN